MPPTILAALIIMAIIVLAALAALLTLNRALGKVAAIVAQYRLDKGDFVQTETIDDVYDRNPVTKPKRRIRPFRWFAFALVAVFAGWIVMIMNGWAEASTTSTAASPNVNLSGVIVLILGVGVVIVYIARRIWKAVKR